MKMTSNLNDISDSNCIVFSPATETSGLMDLKSHKDSYICTIEEDEVCDKLNKSELDIEIEMCEELLSAESDQAECLKFDKENVSDLSERSDSESLSTVNTDNYLIKMNENELCNEGQLSVIAPVSPLSDSVNMHTTIDDKVISKCKDQLRSSQEKGVKIIFETTRNAENQPCTEGNDPLKFTFNEFENKETSVLLGLSELEEDTVVLKYQNGGECQSMKCNEVNNDEKQFPVENYEGNTLICGKDDNELAETDVSTIEEFEMSILDVTENDDHVTTNENDEDKKEMLDPKGDMCLSTEDNNIIHLPTIIVEKDQKIVSSIVKADQKQIIEDETKDLLDPRWDKIKQLSTDEERYQQVKNCWKCSTVPDPNKNLTYHSFRKRHFKNATISQTKPRKRMASNNLNEHSAKRSRSCTYHLDHQIQTVSAKERKETERIMLEMNNEISRVNRTFEQEMQRQLNPNRGRNPYAFGQLQTNLQNKIASIRSQYSRQADHCITEVESEIHALNVARNEVLQFYKFYKGLNSRNDPTVLTFEQNLELEEIENVYSKFNQLYK